MKKIPSLRRLLDPLLHRCEIGHLTLTCANPACVSGKWQMPGLCQGQRRFVSEDHFDASGCCKEHPASKES